MNPALTSYVLVDEANQPVPLPFHTRGFGGTPVTALNFEPPRTQRRSGRIICESGQFYPSVCDLRIVTKNEYMATQAGRPPFHLIDLATSEAVPLPHYLSNDQTVTSIDSEYLFCETTRAITWLDPSKYGLVIVADCDLQVTS